MLGLDWLENGDNDVVVYTDLVLDIYRIQACPRDTMAFSHRSLPVPCFIPAVRNATLTPPGRVTAMLFDRIDFFFAIMIMSMGMGGEQRVLCV